MTSRDQYDELVDRLRALGAADPAVWAWSEVAEGTPQLTRFRFLRGLWPKVIDGWRLDIDTWLEHARAAAAEDPNTPFADALAAAERALGLGLSTTELGAFARAVAYAAVFAVLYRLDDPTDEDLDTGLQQRLPTWVLAEVAGEELTGRTVDRLYDDLLTVDPSGREGRPA